MHKWVLWCFRGQPSPSPFKTPAKTLIYAFVRYKLDRIRLDELKDFDSNWLDMERWISNIIWDTLRQSNVAREHPPCIDDVHWFPPKNRFDRGFQPSMQPLRRTPRWGPQYRWQLAHISCFNPRRPPEAPTVLAPEQFSGNVPSHFSAIQMISDIGKYRKHELSLNRRPANGPKLEGSRCSKTGSRTKVTSSWNLGILEEVPFYWAVK